MLQNTSRTIPVEGEVGVRIAGALVHGVPVIVETAEPATTVRLGPIERSYPGLGWSDAADRFFDEFPVVDGGCGIG